MSRETAAERENLNYLMPSDIEWLRALGSQSDEDEDAWLEYMEGLAEKGSLAIDDLVAADIEEVRYARQLFFSQLSEIRPSVLKGLPDYPKIDTFIAAMRRYSAADIDVRKLCNSFPPAMLYTETNLEEKLTGLSGLGIKPAPAVNKYPPLIGLSTSTVSARVGELNSFVTDSASAINSCPQIVAYTGTTLGDKADFYSSKGLDFRKMLDKNPRFLPTSNKKVAKNMSVLYAAAKAWGIDNYKDYVDEIVEQWPTILTYKTSKLQVLVRIASAAIEPMPQEEITLSNITKSVKSNLEAVLVGYLQNKDEIEHPNDLSRLGNRYKKIGKQALLEIIRQNLDDPVVKAYLRGYPL